MLSMFCTVAVLIGQIATSTARYGILCGWIMVLLQLLPIHLTSAECAAEQESRHCRARAAAHKESRHCRAQGLTVQHGTVEGGLGRFWEPEPVNGKDSAMQTLHRRKLLGGHLPGGMRRGFLSPQVKKKPSAASSSNSNVEAADALVQRKAREAGEALQGFARDHQLDTAVRCEFTHFEAGGQGIGRLACFKWIMTRPSDKLYLFDHDHPLEAKTGPVRLVHLRAERSVEEPENWKMLLRWEQFHNVATDAQKRATEKFGMPVQCEYIGAAVPKGRAGGAPTYELNPAKWPASALRDGKASNAEIWFRFWSVRGLEFVSIRVDNLQDQQLALPFAGICEATVVRRQPRVGPKGEHVDMYIDAALVAEYDEAYLKFRASAEERQLSQKQRSDEFQSLADRYSRDVRHSWTQVAEWAKDKRLQVRFIMADDHDRLCALHKQIFNVEHSVAAAEASADEPLRVLWAHVLETVARDAPRDSEEVKAQPKSLLLRQPPEDHTVTSLDYTNNRFILLQPEIAAHSPCNWSWRSSFTDFVKDHVRERRRTCVTFCQNITEKDVYAFGDFFDLAWQRYPVYHPTWAIPWTSVVFKDRGEMTDRFGSNPSRPWSLCILCDSVLQALADHPTWPPLVTLVKTCKRYVTRSLADYSDRRLDKEYNPPFPYATEYKAFRDAVLDIQPLWIVDPEATWGWAHMASHGEVSYIQELLDCRADINMPSVFGHTALHAAAAYGHLDVLKMLCSAGAVCNIACIGGYTALHMATGHSDALLSIRSKEEPCPVFRARGRRDELSVYQRFCSISDNVDMNEMCAVLCAARANPDAAAADGWTPLHCAADLCSHLACSTQRNVRTALTSAGQVTQVLLQAKAHLDVQDRRGVTPLAMLLDALALGTVFESHVRRNAAIPSLVTCLVDILHDYCGDSEADRLKYRVQEHLDKIKDLDDEQLATELEREYSRTFASIARSNKMQHIANQMAAWELKPDGRDAPNWEVAREENREAYEHAKVVDPTFVSLGQAQFADISPSTARLVLAHLGWIDDITADEKLLIEKCRAEKGDVGPREWL